MFSEDIGSDLGRQIQRTADKDVVAVGKRSLVRVLRPRDDLHLHKILSEILREEARRETWVNRGKGAEKAAQYLIDKVQELTKKEEK